MKISVLIPTKNEPCIGELVENIHKRLKKYSHEIIIIDKSDSPVKILGTKTIFQKSRGLGNAILEGLNHATGDIIITMDGDGSHRAQDLPKLIVALKRSDIVIGSKFIKGGRTLDLTHRKLISLFFRKLAFFLLDLNVKDPMSGFSAIKKEVYEIIKPNPIGYKINLEIIYKAQKLGLKIIEVPIIFQQRRAGKTKAGILEGLRTILFLFKLKLGL